MAVDGAGDVFFSDDVPFNSAVRERNAATGAVSTLVSAGLNQPSGVAVDGSGNVFITDSDALLEWDAATGTVSTLVSRLSAPTGVAVDLSLIHI